MTLRDTLALGALLHDIGKFWQRTGHEPHLAREFEKGEVGRHGLHAVWSGEFFRRYVKPRFPEAAAAGLFAQFHHNPKGVHSADEPESERLARFVQEADHLASRFDREKRPSDHPKGDPIISRLESVAERISFTAGRRPQARLEYPLVPLSVDDAVFPVDKSKAPSRDAMRQQYAALWQGFVDEHERTPTGSFTAYFDSLVHLLHKYTWAIPSAAYVDYPSISLYDHSRLASALSVCLYDLADASRLASDASDARFLLVQGDVSGIQQFIYTPAFNGEELQDGVARRLRGRSFYISLLVRALADALVDALGLYSVNCLWATGGHLLVVAPDTPATRERLAAAQRRIQRWMLAEFRGALGVAFAAVDADADGLKDFGATLDRLGHESARRKLRQIDAHIGLGHEPPDPFWRDPWSLNIGVEVCRDTGRDMDEDETHASDACQRTRDAQPPRSAQSLHFNRIGRMLVDARTLQMRRSAAWRLPNAAHRHRSADDAVPIERVSDHLTVAFDGLGVVWTLSKSETPLPDAHTCLRLADHRNPAIDFVPEGCEAAATSVGFLLAATAVPRQKATHREPITNFSEMADDALGARLLGVLRMDVDNLGAVFAAGLPETERSISKIANLSRMLDWFFSGYLDTLAVRRNVYTTYAGGDDLFLVGPWNAVVDVASDVRAEFARFCGHNPNLHISGGIALCKPKYPIGHAALDAGEALDQIAKRPSGYSLPDEHDDGKDSLALLERKIPWARWDELRRLADRLLDALQGENRIVSRGFLYNLLGFYRSSVDPRRDPAQVYTPTDPIWKPRFLYSLVRNVNDHDLRAELIRSILDRQNMHYLPVLAGYVMLRSRAKDADRDTGESPNPIEAAQ